MVTKKAPKKAQPVKAPAKSKPKVSSGLKIAQAKKEAKENLFVAKYIELKNGTKAAEAAGYSAKTAGSAAYRLLKNVEILEAIIKGTEEMVAAVNEETKIDAQWVLNRLVEEADADLADIYSDNGGLKPVKDWPMAFRRGLIAGVETHQEYDYIEGEKIPAGVIKKLKLSDRIKRLELIGKHVQVQAFRDQVGIGNPDGTDLTWVREVIPGKPRPVDP